MAMIPPTENPGPSNVNPYAPPESALADIAPLDIGGDLAEAEAIRRAHLNHEAALKSIGSLHYLAAFFCLIGAVGLFSFALRTPPEGKPSSAIVLALVGYL